MPASLASTACQSVNGRSSDVLITMSALVARIFAFRSASNPDITDSAMMGAPVPRKTPKIENAVKTVKSANSAPSRVSSNPTPIADHAGRPQPLDDGQRRRLHPLAGRPGVNAHEARDQRSGREAEPAGDQRRHADQQRAPRPPLRIAQVPPGDEPFEPRGKHRLRRQSFSGRISGNRMTSRIDGWSVSSITRRSMPIPSPAVGGRPYSSARQ